MQRKVFRIEQMAGNRHAAAWAPRPARHVAHTTGDGQGLHRELSHLREVVAGVMRDLSALLAEGKERRMARAAGELGAAVDTMEKATNQILQSAEVIDDCSRALGFAQKTDYDRGLAQDIQEHVIRLYEACNFHDLAGQRIGKVIATLDAVDARVSEAIARCQQIGPGGPPAALPPKGGLLNGPRLDGDGGHASQGEIDAMFD